MRKALGLTAALCGLAGFGAQAQSLDTLQFAAQYQNGVSVTHDTVFAQRKKIAVPTAVNVLPSNVPYTATLRFIGENDTLVANYQYNGSTMQRTLNISGSDTVYASHLDFQVSFDAPVQNGTAIISLLMTTSPFEVAICSKNTACYDNFCNNNFSSLAGGLTCQSYDADNFGMVKLADSWTSTGFAHYFTANCNSSYRIDQTTSSTNTHKNPFGNQTGADDTQGEDAYVGISAHFYSEESNVTNGFLEQTRQTPLLAGYRYVGTFSVSLADYSRYKIGGLGMRASNGSTNVGFTSNTAVAITTDWQPISGVINVPIGINNLTTLSIGNFGNATPVEVNAGNPYNGAYYFIDKMRLSIVPKDLTPEMSICGTSVTLGENDPNVSCTNINTTIKWEKYKGHKPQVGHIWETISNQFGQTLTIAFTENQATYRRTVTIDGVPFVSVCTVSKQEPATVEIETNNRTVVCTNVPFTVSASDTELGSYQWSATQWLDNPTGNPRYDSVINSPNFYTLTNGTTPTATFNFNAGGMYIIKVLVGDGECSFLARTDTIDVIKDCCVKQGTAMAFSGNLTHLNDSAVGNPRTLIVLGNPRKTESYAALPTPVAPEMNTRYYVAGNIEFTSNITPPQDSRFYVRGKAISQTIGGVVNGPYITMQSGTHTNNNILTLRGVIIRAACDTMWGGISMRPFTFFDALATTEHPNRIEDSYDGLCLYGTGTANENDLHTATRNIYRTFFVNNYRSIQFLGKTRLSRVTVTSNGEPASRAIVRSVFTSDSSQMKLPFHKRTSSNFYFTYAHLSNQGFEVSEEQNNCIVQNYMSNALYGIKLQNHKNQITVVSPLLENCKIAGVWHTDGNLTMTGTHQPNFPTETNNANAGALYAPFNRNVGIYLPQQELSTEQINQERNAIGLATSQAGLQRGRTFGIYAESIHRDVQDLLAHRMYISTDAPSQTILKQEEEPDSSEARFVLREEQYNQIGYYGRNTTFVSQYDSMNANTPEEGRTGFADRFTNLRTGIMLEGSRGNANIRGNIFTNNRTSVHIHRTASSDINLRLNCNEFISSFAANTVATTGLLLTCTNGADVTVNENENEQSVLGGCNDNDGRPNGNEVRRIINPHNTGLFQNNASTGNVPMVVEVPLNDFTFINNQLPQTLRYRRWRNENVAYEDLLNPAIRIKRVNTRMEDCGILAGADSCRKTTAGILNRQGQGDDSPRTTAKPNYALAYLGGNIPNPSDSHDGTEIHYEIPEGVQEAKLIVYAPLSGKPLYTEVLTQAKGSVVVNTINWATGVYPYVLILDGRVVRTQKMAVMQ